ncbi:MAG: hypothetical protein QOE55_542 [Acidobacteriaceae bacterium]|jgi:hypothetical protein|nr:hypothetical protein [Acidobacteriaceae bacterium]
MAEAALNAKEPDVVYHYTTMDTMTKIAQGASIWATSISYLNDVSEGDHFLKLVRKRIPGYLVFHSVNESIFEDFLKEPDLMFSTFETRPFVVSFSQEADSLPQWRSYCPDGNGVAIGFRADCLKRASIGPTGNSDAMQPSEPAPGSFFKKVDYVDSFDDGFIDSEIDWSISCAKLLAKTAPSSTPDIPPAAYFKLLIERAACFIKHPSFSNENEYRLLVDAVFSKRHYLGFRSTRSTLRPYIPVTIPRRHSHYANSTEPIMSAPCRALGFHRPCRGRPYCKHEPLPRRSLFLL